MALPQGHGRSNASLMPLLGEGVGDVDLPAAVRLGGVNTSRPSSTPVSSTLPDASVVGERPEQLDRREVAVDEHLANVRWRVAEPLGGIVEQLLHPLAELVPAAVLPTGIGQHHVVGEQTAHAGDVLGVEVLGPLAAAPLRSPPCPCSGSGARVRFRSRRERPLRRRARQSFARTRVASSHDRKSVTASARLAAVVSPRLGSDVQGRTATVPAAQPRPRAQRLPIRRRTCSVYQR